MSLINKMLQDLDARGSQGGAGLQSEIKPVLVAERGLPRRQIAIAAAIVTCGVAVGLALWVRRPVPAVAPVAVLVPAPAAVVTPAPVVAPAPVATAPAASVAPPVAASDPSEVKAPQAVLLAEAEAAMPVRAQRRAPAAPIKRNAVPTPAAAPIAVVPSGRQMTPAQQADSQYRQALAALDDGRISSAVGHLEQALQRNSRHEGARQTLVGLLIEAGRQDEAVRQLEQGLAADAGQPALAMLLARIQIEQGGSGVATLLRTLPSAQSNGDFRAFLAGALQRDGRHREAAEQYATTLRTAPNNAV